MENPQPLWHSWQANNCHQNVICWLKSQSYMWNDFNRGLQITLWSQAGMLSISFTFHSLQWLDHEGNHQLQNERYHLDINWVAWRPVIWCRINEDNNLHLKPDCCVSDWMSLQNFVYLLATNHIKCWTLQEDGNHTSIQSHQKKRNGNGWGCT